MCGSQDTVDDVHERVAGNSQLEATHEKLKCERFAGGSKA